MARAYTTASPIVKVANRWLNLLWPSECLVCGREGAWLCDPCQSKITLIKQPTCPFCDRLSPLGKSCTRCQTTHKLSGCRSWGYYTGALQTVVKQYKFGGITAATDVLADHLTSLVAQLPLTGNWVVTSVPMTPRKRGQRGFNQAELLARAVASRAERPYEPLLRRTQEGKQQSTLARAARFSNASGLFALAPRAIVTRQVLIVDDVLTTGATLEACARALKQAGTRSVWGLTVARD